MSTEQATPRRLDQIPTTYDPQATEQRVYAWWEENGYFKPRPNPARPPFVISMPPPNVTGALHLGHALTATVEDIMVRYHRMRGDETLWVPGEDHAGIATQAVVERRLFEEEKKTRHDLGRQGLIDRIWKWKDQYESRILNQLKQLGCSCDWARAQFTF
ncbi:MAG: class I tRNA ligase family protein, partial [Ktedonobacterales bacterium]